jgi:hypothetical protein
MDLDKRAIAQIIAQIPPEVRYAPLYISIARVYELGTRRPMTSILYY